MPKKPSPQVVRILKQVLLLALPLILKALKNRKASNGGQGSPKTVASGGVPLTTKPTRARKRENSKPLPEPPKEETRPASSSRSAAGTRGSLIAELFRQRRSD
ncbi:MAG: hypothetical protein AAGL98_12555, partial [Planctomycetota bacterium]